MALGVAGGRAAGGLLERAEHALRAPADALPLAEPHALLASVIGQKIGRSPWKGPLPAWGRAEAWAWLGRVHERRGDLAAARDAFEKALELEPGYEWVRHGLLPRLSRRRSLRPRERRPRAALA